LEIIIFQFPKGFRDMNGGRTWIVGWKVGWKIIHHPQRTKKSLFLRRDFFLLLNGVFIMTEVFIVMWKKESGHYEVGSVHTSREDALKFGEELMRLHFKGKNYTYRVLMRPLNRG
jgi:hypothetical protein